MPLPQTRSPLALLALAAVALSGCGHLVPDTAPSTTIRAEAAPDDHFYVPPAPLPAGGPGDVIWARALHNGAALPDAARNWLVLYRSTDIDGKAIAVSGTVAVPKGAPPEGGWPVISWTHGTTGIANACAPSKNGPQYSARGYVSLINDSLNEWLKQGYAVVKTDYQGLGTPGQHPYLMGEPEARGAIDMVRAARELEDGLGRNWLVMGHSQGGQAAVYTSYLGPLYAPELNLTGAVALSPASHLSEQIGYAWQHPDTPASAYGALMLNAAAAMSPEVDLSRLLTPLGRERVALTEEHCVAELAGPDGFGGLTSRDVMNLDADPQALLDVFNTLSDSENLRPAVPLLVLQADNDRVVLERLTTRMVQRFRNASAEVEYQVHHSADTGGAASHHQATVPATLPKAMDWVDRRFRPVR